MPQSNNLENYFEDFQPGEVLRHARGKTITEMDNVLITNLVMNTAAGHFDEHMMKDRMFKQRIVFGGITIAMIIGLASQDTAENAVAELSLDGIRLPHPVFHGDTLYAYTKVIEKSDADREDCGVVRFHHWGLNQDDAIVFEGDRSVLVKRRSHWGSR
jgi:acyl dehydratase